MLEEKDVEILDEFIRIILDGHDVYSSEFTKLPYFNKFKDSYLEFERLAMILHKENLAQVHNIGSNSKLVLRKNQNTENFKKSGGFTNAYKNQLIQIEKENEIQTLSMSKLRFDTKLSKWQLKTFWPVFISGLLGFIFGLYNIITQITDSRKTKELQIELKNTQEEVSKLRTLVLDQKTADSLHNPKTDVDTLSIH